MKIRIARITGHFSAFHVATDSAVNPSTRPSRSENSPPITTSVRVAIIPSISTRVSSATTVRNHRNCRPSRVSWMRCMARWNEATALEAEISAPIRPSTTPSTPPEVLARASRALAATCGSTPGISSWISCAPVATVSSAIPTSDTMETIATRAGSSESVE